MKILNCITNSFFRTIGRMLAYLAIGALLVALLSKAHLPSFEEIINDSLFMKVNAEQIVVPVNPRASEYYITIPNWSSGWTLDATQNFARNSFWSHDYIQEHWIQLGSNDFTTDIDYLEFTFLANEPYTTTISNTDNYCIEWDITSYTDIALSNGDHGVLHDVYTCKKYGNNDNNDVYTSTLGNYALYFEIEFTNGNKPMCTMTGTSVICPTNHQTPYKLHIYTYFNTTHNTAFDFNISRHVRGYYIQDQQQIINNQNQNTQQIIQNQQASTNATIENQNQNTQEQIQSQKVCQFIDKSNIVIKNKRLISGGDTTDAQGFGVTDYINIIGSTIDRITQLDNYDSSYSRLCFYNTNKNNISCVNPTSIGQIDIPQGASFVRFSINENYNKPTYNICQNGNQALSNSMNDTNVSDSTNQADSFFSNFTTADQGGLSGIITAPLSAIQSLTSSTCSPLVIPLPYINENLTLPCMRSIYESFFGDFIILYDTITIGIISYWVIVRIFNLVKDFKNPDHDEIEVLDL